MNDSRTPSAARTSFPHGNGRMQIIWHNFMVTTTYRGLEINSRMNQAGKKLMQLRNRLSQIALATAVVCFCLLNSLWAEESSILLDGMTFVGKNGEIGKKLAEYEDEEIIFEKGMFTSVSCEPYNFGSSPYNAKAIGDKIHFEAVTASPTHGKISWAGIIDGDEAEVKFVWTKERWYWDIRREYWFKGKLKK